MPTKKKPAKSISPAITDSATTKTHGAQSRVSGPKRPVSLGQKTQDSSESVPKARVRKAHTPNATGVFEKTHHQAEIAHEAYLLWVSRGRAHGGDFEDWINAIEIVRQRYLE